MEYLLVNPSLMNQQFWSKRYVRRPGVEPGSTAWKATMLTVTPPTLLVIQYTIVCVIALIIYSPILPIEWFYLL